MAAAVKNKFLGKVSRDAHRQKQKASSFGYLNLPRNLPTFKEEPGSRVRMDILPYTVTDDRHPDRDDEFGIATPGSLWYKRPFKVHRSVGTDNTSLVCPTTIGKKCPICEYRAKLLKDGANWKDDAVKELRPRDRNLYYVVPIGHNKYEEVPHLWDISQSLFQEKLNDELEENEGNGGFPDLEDGKTLRIRFSEEEFGKNKFADTSRIDFDDREGVVYKESILKGLPSLDDILDIKDYATIERIFLQAGDEDEGEEAEGDEEKRTPARSTRRQHVAEEPDERVTTTRARGQMEEAPEEPEAPPPARERGRRNPEPESEEPPARTRREAPADSTSGTQRTRTPRREPEPEPEEAPPVTRRTQRTARGPETEKCPFGHRFGPDADEFEDCGSCELWDDCMAERERLGA